MANELKGKAVPAITPEIFYSKETSMIEKPEHGSDQWQPLRPLDKDEAMRNAIPLEFRQSFDRRKIINLEDK